MERRAYLVKSGPSSPSSGAGVARRGLEDAVKYCSTGWFPVQGQHLRSIQVKLEQGAYDRDTKQLIQEVKADVGLFVHCLKNLHTVSHDVSCYRNPVIALEHLGTEELRELLLVPEERISSHSATDLPKVQALRLKHSLISSVTAETLAERTGDDPGLSYSCALFRQLGLTLVCFNYPTIYNRALTAASTGEGELESNLQKLLGFSPDALARRLLADWKFGDNIGAVLGKKTSRIGTGMWEEEQRDPLLRIVKFCEVGETVARVNDPEHFPSAGREWEMVSRELHHVGGPDALKFISDKLDRAGQIYSSSTPRAFSLELSPEKSIAIANAHYSNHLFQKNGFLLKCSDEVKAKFRGGYAHIKHNQVSPEALNELSIEILPYLGFIKGCIYLLDERSMLLVPRLRLGNSTLKRYRPISCATETDMSHPLADAFYSATPLRQEDVFMHNDLVSHLSWSIGNSNKAGILHLEWGEDARRFSDSELLTVFKAVCQYVNDSLSLR